MQITSLLRKGLVVGIIFLFVGTGIIPSMAQDIEKPSLPTSRGHWLYVGGSGPGNYTRIQDAIDNASNGDTVYVYDDSSPYNEYVKINTSIHLVGENQKTTVIDGQGLIAVSLKADAITFTGFTVQNTGFLSFGLYVFSNNNTIRGNIFSNNFLSDIYLTTSNNNTITENTFSNSAIGICLSESNDTTITRNIITKNHGYGIALANSRRNLISQNNILDNGKYDAFFTRDIGIFPLSNHWDANYWGRPYLLPKRIHGQLILFENHPRIALPLVNFDWFPAREPYNIGGMR